jgi:hypothetical protein
VCLQADCTALFDRRSRTSLRLSALISVDNYYQVVAVMGLKLTHLWLADVALRELHARLCVSSCSLLLLLCHGRLLTRVQVPVGDLLRLVLALKPTLQKLIVPEAMANALAMYLPVRCLSVRLYVSTEHMSGFGGHKCGHGER